MKIFISSIISGFGPFRSAAKSAIETLRHTAVMAEDFAAQPQSPQISCLKGVREADLVVLILGSKYGATQGTSRVSPTHEEYLEARGKKPILAFVQNGATFDEKQAALVADVQGWQSGLFRAGFDDADDLQAQIIRAIHEHQLANAAAPLDLKQLEKNARELVAEESRRQSSGGPFLKLAVVGGPIQQVLRPARLEDNSLKEALQQHALFGEHRLFNIADGVDDGIDDGDLFLAQKNGARIQLNERGFLVFRQPIKNQSRSRDRSGFMLAIIEETVLEQFNRVIGYASWILEHIDATQRLTHVAIAAAIEGSNHLGWRTQAEQDASPNSGQIRYNRDEARSVCVNRPRAALRFNRTELAEDLMVPLRRQYKD